MKKKNDNPIVESPEKLKQKFLDSITTKQLMDYIVGNDIGVKAPDGAIINSMDLLVKKNREIERDKILEALTSEQMRDILLENTSLKKLGYDWPEGMKFNSMDYLAKKNVEIEKKFFIIL